MTIEVSGLAGTQARVAELQARLGTPASPAAASATGFDASMTRALSGGAGGAGQKATLAALFVADPTKSPGQVVTKDGASQVFAAAAKAAATRSSAPAASAAPAATTASAAGAARTPSAPSAPSAAVPAVSAASVTPSVRRTSSAAAAVSTAPVTATAAAAKTAATAKTAAASGPSRADAVIATAKKYLGIPYVWGGTNPKKGLDCSGLVQLVYKQHGIKLPRVARDQQKMGESVPSLSQARPGDLVTFGKPATHIGIYVGDGKMLHAPRTGDVVKIAKVYRTPSSIRRVLPDGAWQAGGAAAAAPQAAAPAKATAAAKAVTAPQATPAAAAVNPTTAPAAARAATLASTGGWAGDPTAAADTWGAASAQAAEVGIQALLEQGPGAATGGDPATAVAAAAKTAASTPAAAKAAAAVAETVAATPGSVLAQAPERFRSLFVSAARKYGVPADLLAAVAKQESNFKPHAVSHAGARGLMQLMPGTARALGVRDSFDPAQAVDGAARLLRDHLKTFRGSTELALAAYNAGPGAVRRYDGVPPYSETQNYVRKIMANLRAGAV